MRIIRFDRAKFKELILYIAAKSERDERFGSVKLNKLLYYADFESYRKLGHSITGADYQHIPEGPAPRALLPVKKRLIADREPNLESFTPEELSLVDEIVQRYWGYSGIQITDEAHKEFGWRLTDDGESIPYSSAWFSSAPLTMKEIEIGREIAREYGLLTPCQIIQSVVDR